MNTIGIENPVELMKKDRFVDSNNTPIVVEVKCECS
jgi:hypothetical protein